METSSRASESRTWFDPVEVSLEPFVAVASDKRDCAVYPPNPRGETYDWRALPRTEFNTAGILPAYTPTSIHAALGKTYNTDAHMVSYVVFDRNTRTPLTKQPRLAKSSLAWMRVEGYEPLARVLLVDIDNPHCVDADGARRKCPWTDEMRIEFDARWSTLQSRIPGVGLYFTDGGARGVHILPQWVSPEDAERHLLWLIETYRALGLAADEHCRDWTRLFRLPDVLRRDDKNPGKTFRSRVERRLDGMSVLPVGCVGKSSTQADRRESTRSRADREPRPAWQAAVEDLLDNGEPFATEIDPAWSGLAATVGATLAGSHGNLHYAFMYLAGALLRESVPPEQVPVVVERAATAAGSSNPGHHRATAIMTLQRAAQGISTRGLSGLRELCPAAAEAFERAMMRFRRPCSDADDRAGSRGDQGPQAWEQFDRMRDFIEFSALGPSLLMAETGIGKSRATLDIAERRSIWLRAAAIMAARGRKYTAGRRIGIATPTKALAVQHVEEMRAKGVDVVRLFSPCSAKRDERDPRSLPICVYYDAAKLLMDAGVNTTFELCEGRGQHPCPYQTTCRAYSGVDGHPRAAVVVGTQDFLGDIRIEIGDGLLVIDEIGTLVDTEVMTLTEIDAAMTYSGLSHRHRTAMRPAFEALRGYVEELGVEQDHGVPLEDMIREGANAIDPQGLRDACDVTGVAPTGDAAADAVECVKASRGQDKKEMAKIPLLWSEIERVKAKPTHAQVVGRVAKTYNMLYKALMSSPERLPAAWFASDAENGRHIVFKRAQATLIDVLGGPGSTVAMDADIPLFEPIISHALGYKPPLLKMVAADGHEVERTRLLTRQASRTGLLHPPDWRRIARSIEFALDWASQDPRTRKLGIITFKIVRLAIDMALGCDDPETMAQAREIGLEGPMMIEATRAMNRVLARWDGGTHELRMGHYGAVRGLNSFMSVDALVTIGDPFPNLDDVRRTCAFANVPGLTWERLARMEAEAEAGQAQGRMRFPQLSRRVRVAHLGNIIPAGYGWTNGSWIIKEVDLDTR